MVWGTFYAKWHTNESEISTIEWECCENRTRLQSHTNSYFSMQFHGVKMFWYTLAGKCTSNPHKIRRVYWKILECTGMQNVLENSCFCGVYCTGIL